MQSFVNAMRHGRLFLAGDAAHIVPPTGAKDLNLAVADVTILATALVRLLKEKQTSLVDSYSDRTIARASGAAHFSWFMTSMLHRSGDDFDAELQLANCAGSPRRRRRTDWPRTTPGCHSRPEPPLPATLCPWRWTPDGTQCSPRPTEAGSPRCARRLRPARALCARAGAPAPGPPGGAGHLGRHRPPGRPVQQVIAANEEPR